jgi:hypothetical protein
MLAIAGRCAVLVLIVASDASAQSGIPAVSIRPANPSPFDSVAVTACYGAGPFVETTAVQRNGLEIDVLFVQSGIDFSPNPPHCATAQIDRLPPGQYTVVVNNREPPLLPSVQRFPLTVSPTTVPIPASAWLFLVAVLAWAGVRRAQRL